MTDDATPRSRGAVIEIDIEGERVRKDGEELRITRKSFHVLKRLMRTPDVIVSKDDLIEDVWEGRAVTDGVVTTAMRELREALGDPSRDPIYIQTVYGLGYRFLPAVSQDGGIWRTPTPPADDDRSAGVEAGTAAPSRNPEGRARPSKTLAAAGLALIVLIGGAAFWLASTQSAPEREAVALPVIPADQFSIGVARLQNDPASGNFTRAVIDALRFALNDPNAGEASAILIESIPRTVSIEGDATRQALALSEDRARELLNETGADILIWGEVMPELGSYTLRVTAPDARNFGRYDFDDIKFGAALLDDVAPILIGHAVAEAKKIDIAVASGDVLGNWATRLKPLAINPPAGLRADDAGQLVLAYAQLGAKHGEAAGDRPLLEEIAALLREEIARQEAEDAPLARRLRARQLLGNTLSMMGSLGEPVILRDAVEEMEALADMVDRAAFPHEWGMTHSELGMALAILTNQELDERSDDAIEAYRRAMLEITEETYPDDWARLQTNLANMLSQKAEDTGDFSFFEQANEAYAAALSVRRRDTQPSKWALNQFNIAFNEQFIGEKSNNAPLIHAAIERYRTTLEIWTEESMPANAAAVLNKISDAYYALSKDFGEPLWDDAEEAISAGLEFVTPEGSSSLWANMNNQLGDIHAAQAQFGTPGAYDNAAAAYEEALSVLHPDTSPVKWANTTEDWANLAVFHADRTDDPVLAEAALERLMSRRAVVLEHDLTWSEQDASDLRAAEELVERFNKKSAMARD